MVCCEKARIWWSFKYKIKNVIKDGLLGGCLKHFSGSGLSQYSSSQSTGKSKSRLMNYVNIDLKERRRFALLILNGARSTQGGTDHSVHAYEYPVHFGDSKSQQRVGTTYQNARFNSSSLGVSL